MSHHQVLRNVLTALRQADAGPEDGRGPELAGTLSTGTVPPDRRADVPGPCKTVETVRVGELTLLSVATRRPLCFV